MLKLFLLLAWLGVFESSALSLSHWELELANRTCDGKASCEQERTTRMGDELDWRDRNCFCDKLCAVYGDCCTDSPFFIVSEQRRGSASFSCVDLRQFGGIYMKTSCPPDWGDMDVREACEEGSEDRTDPLAATPATSHSTGITYRNLHCAICHREYDLDVWHPRLECPSVNIQNVTREMISNSLHYDKQEDFWGLILDGEFHACSLDPVLPETSSHIVRRCLVGAIKTCAVNWTNVDVRNRCEAYTSVVYSGQDIFRNPHCAMCNNVPLQYLQCSRVLFRTQFDKDFSPNAFSILFDLSGTGSVGKIEPCGTDELYDPFFKRCRSVFTELRRKKKSESYDHSTVNLEVPNVIEFLNAENDTVEYPEVCPKFVLEREEVTLENGTAYVPQYKKTFLEGEFTEREDGGIEVCVGNLGVKILDKFGIYMGYVTFAGLGISIIFLTLHLTAFCLVSELRNLSGKNLASLCIALLIAYATFMAGQVLEGTSCFVISVVTFYFFIASFTWMLTMAFDVWRTLRLATAELRVSSGKQWRKFTIYSIWSWIAPAVIVGSALFVEFAPPDAVSPEWRPTFGINNCWFGKKNALLVFFAAPVAVIMCFNCLFFGSSAHMIYSTTSTTRFTASASTQRDFRLYLRLAVVMGLTWSVGLIAGVTDVTSLWYAFIALNTLQGLFIFLAFTCTNKVIRGLAVRQTDSKPLRPPSFSWSSDSTTRKSHMGSEPATTDTLY